jgi:hypothetical protein
VLERFGDVRWDKSLASDHAAFESELAELQHSLTETPRTAISLQQC